MEEGTQTEGGLDSHPASTQAEGGLGCHPTGTQTEGGLGYHPASNQTEGLGYHPSLKLLQEFNQARAKIEHELVQETQELAERYEHKWAK